MFQELDGIMFQSRYFKNIRLNYNIFKIFASTTKAYDVKCFRQNPLG